MQNGSYSLLDLSFTINGPGGGPYNLAGLGVAKEGVTVAMRQDKGSLLAGGDGSFMHSLHGDQTGNITLRCLKTSPINRLLSGMMDFDSLTAANWGQNFISIKHNVTGDAITAEGCAFGKRPDLSYAEDGGMNEWTWACGRMNPKLGDGTQV